MFCLNCGKKINEKDKFCAYCGAALENNIIEDETPSEKSKPQKRTWGCLLVIIIFSIFVSVFSDKDTQTPNISKNQSKTVQKVENKKNLEVIKSGPCFVDGTGTLGICGIVKNNTNRTYSYAQIEINLYDNAENLIATAIDNINNIPPQGTWKFTAHPLSYGISVFRSYSIVKVTGW